MNEDKKFITGCKVCGVILWISCILCIISAVASVAIISSLGANGAGTGVVTMFGCIAASILYGWLAGAVNKAVKYIESSEKKSENTENN